MFAQVVRPFHEGGICGLKFRAEHTQKVGDTLNVQWRADAPFLARAYRGADACETKDGLMQAHVTTFKLEDLKTKWRWLRFRSAELIKGSASALLYLHQIFKWAGNEALYDLSRHVSRGLHALPSRWLCPDGG